MATLRSRYSGWEAPSFPGDGFKSVELLKRVRHGDEEALDILSRRYLVRLQRRARQRIPSLLRGLVDADDLVQETLTRSIRVLRKFRPKNERALRAYLFKALDNRIRDELRRIDRVGRAITLTSQVSDRRPGPIDDVMIRETRERYLAALRRLRPEDRRAVRLRLEHRESWKSLMLTLDKPSVDATRMAVCRALRRLMREMAAQH
jgi:RNA polymerase sigma factor (sigma-70 family)